MLMDEWHGCYKRGWGRELVPEAFSHPAKVSFSLAERIYAHMAEEGWIEPGMTVLDPFAGIGGCAYHALKHGLHFIGVELEPKFVDLAAQNIALWNQRYAGRFARWGTAQVIQGDSRRLADVVREVGVCVSSPPFSDTGIGGNNNVVNYNRQAVSKNRPDSMSQEKCGLSYSSTPGNLGNLRATDAGFSAAVSSPPYATDALGHSRGEAGELREATGKHKQGHTQGKMVAADYGTTPGQLAEMRADGFDSAVSSPPWEDQEPSHAQGTDFGLAHDGGRRFIDSEYGSSDGQLGSSSRDGFWSAARIIVEQTYAVLRPGAHAVWVVKSFVRAGALVDFPGQWRQLCESVGFVTLHEHHALLVRDDGTQLAMDGNHKSHRTERKSFFRRLAESKGSPRIDHETVYCMVKGE